MQVVLEFQDELSFKLLVDKMIDLYDDILSKEHDFEAAYDLSGVHMGKSFAYHLDFTPTQTGYYAVAEPRQETAH